MAHVKASNNLIVHLLGYVTPHQWADVLKNYPEFSKEEIYALIREQGKRYCYNLMDDVLEEMNK